MLTKFTKRKYIALILVCAFLNLLVYDSIITAKDNKILAPPLIGDVNGDGEVTEDDANLVCQKAAGQPVELALPDNGDINKNGILDAGDAMLIGQQVYGIIDLPHPVLTMAASMQGEYMVEGIARARDVVHIYGEELADSSGGSWVLLNDIPVYPEFQSPGLVTFRVPEGMSFNKVKVQTGFVESNELDFTLTDGPVIGTASPAIGAVGDTVIIIGGGFSETASENQVYFGGLIADVSYSAKDTLKVTVPGISGKCKITIQAAGKESNEYRFYNSTDQLLDILRIADTQEELATAYKTSLEATNCFYDDIAFRNSVAETASEYDTAYIKIGEYFDDILSLNNEIAFQDQPIIDPTIDFSRFSQILNQDVFEVINNPNETHSLNLLLFLSPHGNLPEQLEINYETFMRPIQSWYLLDWMFEEFSPQANNKLWKTSYIDDECMKKAKEDYHFRYVRNSALYKIEIREIVATVTVVSLGLFVAAVKAAIELGPPLLASRLNNLKPTIDVIVLIGKEIAQSAIVSKISEKLLEPPYKEFKKRQLLSESTYWRDTEACSFPSYRPYPLKDVRNCVKAGDLISCSITTLPGHTPHKKRSEFGQFGQGQYHYIQGVEFTFGWTRPNAQNIAISEILYKDRQWNSNFEVQQPPYPFRFTVAAPEPILTGSVNEGYSYCTAYLEIEDLGGQTPHITQNHANVEDVPWKKIHIVPNKFLITFHALRDGEKKYISDESPFLVNDLAEIEITFFGHDLQPVEEQQITVHIDENDTGFIQESKTTDKNGTVRVNKKLGKEPGNLTVLAGTEYTCPVHDKTHTIKSSIYDRIIDKPDVNFYAAKLPAPTKESVQNRVSMSSADITWEKTVPLVGDPWLDQFNLSYFDVPSRPYDFKFVLRDSLSGEPRPGEKVLLKCPQFPLAVANRDGYTDGNGEVIFKNIVFPGDPLWAIKTADTIAVIAHLDGATEPFAEDEYDKVKLIPPSNAPEIWMEGLTIMARDLDGDITARNISVERVDPLAGGLVYLSTHKESADYTDDPNTIWNEVGWQAAYYSNLPKLSVIFVVEDMAGNRTELHKTFVAP